MIIRFNLQISVGTRKAIDNSDMTFKALQQASVSMKGKVAPTKTEIEPSNLLKNDESLSTNVNSLAEMMETTSTSTKS